MIDFIMSLALLPMAISRKSKRMTMATGQYLLWKDAQGQDFRPVALTGTDLLNDRNLNKGTAFTEQERADFELDGLLPPQVQTFEAQLDRVYQGFLSACSDIEKYQNLRALQDRNETLFYALLARHVEEMTPIIYTPTVGKACQEFSHRFRRRAASTSPRRTSMTWAPWPVSWMPNRCASSS
jgi:malate dehydrogenase (oxaloacetate-decarboxylating)